MDSVSNTRHRSQLIAFTLPMVLFAVLLPSGGWIRQPNGPFWLA